jgi:hypothetical protein
MYTQPALLVLPPTHLLLCSIAAAIAVAVCYLCYLQLEEDFIKANPEWVAELELMLKKKQKAEIQPFNSHIYTQPALLVLPLTPRALRCSIAAAVTDCDSC